MRPLEFLHAFINEAFPSAPTSRYGAFITRKTEAMAKRVSALIAAVFLICAIVVGAFIYNSKCRDADACAASVADGQERIKPNEVQ